MAKMPKFKPGKKPLKSMKKDKTESKFPDTKFPKKKK